MLPDVGNLLLKKKNSNADNKIKLIKPSPLDRNKKNEKKEKKKKARGVLLVKVLAERIENHADKLSPIVQFLCSMKQNFVLSL